jgi:hypothetical protein
MFRPVGLALILAALVLAQQPDVSQGDSVKLWPTISVHPTIYYEGNTDALQVHFGLVNDGSATVNPNIESSHLLINGVEPKDWRNVIINGLRTPWFWALPPGQTLDFSYVLGRYFQKPGVYTLRWQAAHFKASDMTLRVLPRPR